MNRKPVLRIRTVPGLLLLVASSCSMLVTGCGSSTKILPTTIAFAPGPMAPPSSVMAHSTVQFAAVVSNDTANGGVSWLLTCASANAADCGSISRHTASGVPTTYIAPLAAPPGGTVTVEANSSDFPNASVTTTMTIAPITYGPISIAFSPLPPASISIGTFIDIFAVVTNDHLDSKGNPMGYTLSVTCANQGTCGVFSGSTYIPPSTVPSGGTVTMTATSVADPTKSVSATVTITPPTVVISLVQLPPTSISAAAATSIGALVQDGTSANAAGKAGVDWSVACGGTTCGSVVPQHTANDDANSSNLQKVTSFAAPSVLPPGGTVTVTAMSTADPTKQASVTITVTAAALNNSLLKGQYAFLLTGAHVDGSSALAGSVIADGNGNITAGEECLPGLRSLVSGIAGSYFIGTDGRGVMTLNGVPGYGFGGWLNGQQMFAITVIDPTHAFMEEFDGSGNYNNLNSTPTPWYGSTLRGELELQQPADFSAPPSGSYAFAAAHAGTTASQPPYTGYYGGVLSVDATGSVTGFQMDRYIDGTTGSIASGTYGTQSFGVLDSFGLGTFQLGPYSFDYLLVDSEHIIFLASSSSDLTGFPAGHMYSQPPSAVPPASTYVFTLAGSTPTNSANGATVVGSSPQAIGGWFASDSSGNITGYLDTNSNGTILSAPVSGTLSPSVVSGSVVSGRWALTLSGGGASQFAVYPTTSHGLLMFQLDTRKSGTGAALVQTVSSPTLQGTYAASLQQLGLINSARNSSVGLPIGLWTDVSGQIIARGSSNLSGSLDIDQLNGLYLAPSGSFWTQTSGASMTGEFASGAQGRFTGSITSTQLATMGVTFYLVDDSTVLILEDDGIVAVGVLQLQNF